MSHPDDKLMREVERETLAKRKKAVKTAQRAYDKAEERVRVAMNERVTAEEALGAANYDLRIFHMSTKYRYDGGKR